MNINELDKKLDDAANDLSNQIRSTYKEGSSEYVTEDDINELTRQVFYTFNNFRESIIEYLKTN